jgi:integrase
MAKSGRVVKRRTRTAHRGVKLLSRQLASGTTVHVARWTDPETKQAKQVSLSSLGKKTAASRRVWAIQKATSLAQARADLAAGIHIEPEKPQTRLDVAVKKYLNSLTDKAPKTRILYARALQHLTLWAAKAKLTFIEELGGKELNSFGKYLRGLRARKSMTGAGVGRGATGQSNRPLAPASLNQFIRGVRTFLADCRREELTPLLTSDKVRDCLRFAKREKPLPRFLQVSQLRDLIEAAQKHDGAKFKITRQENKAGGSPGRTAKYPPILPFLVTALLSGMRFAEMANLRWADVDFEGGAIVLNARATKTHEARRISLAESPALLSLLLSLKQRTDKAPFVFGGDKPLRRDIAEAARRRLCRSKRGFGAPSFTWHDCRRTCGTYLTCAPSIYRGSSAYMSAKRLGHSVTIAERYYVGAITISAAANSIEQAMGIADLLGKAIT